MPITNDTFGNYYMGNFIGGNLVDWTEVLNCFRQALGSNDRANLNTTPGNASQARIDWRPNLVTETLTGVISPPVHPFIAELGFWQSMTLTDGSRLGFSYMSNYQNHSFFPGGGEVNAIANPNNLASINSTDTIWVVANKQSISFFIYRSPSFHYFYSQGFLLNSPLNFPQNAYSIVASYNGLASNTGPIYAYQARGFAGTVVKTMHETGVKANYNHTKLSDGLPTQSEVELYLRDVSTDIPYGYVPNVFKWKVNGGEIAPAIGDVVRLNMANATGEYAGHGNIFCKVVGRSGAVEDTALTEDYILMRVAS